MPLLKILASLCLRAHRSLAKRLLAFEAFSYRYRYGNCERVFRLIMTFFLA
jgi:hypothetical protein